MLHHISLHVSDIKASATLYDAMLSALHYKRVWTDKYAVGYGIKAGEDQFAINQKGKPVGSPGEGFHLAFAAKSREDVDNFYAAGIKNGAKDNGAPGLRPHYGENYYAAYVLDLDGHNIEAVFK